MINFKERVYDWGTNVLSLLLGFNITKQDRLPQGHEYISKRLTTLRCQPPAPRSSDPSARVAPSFAMDAQCLVHRKSLVSIRNSADAECKVLFVARFASWWSLRQFSNQNTRRICQELGSSPVVAQTRRHLAEKLSSVQQRSDPEQIWRFPKMGVPLNLPF